MAEETPTADSTTPEGETTLLRLQWDKGGSATITESDGHFVTVHSSTASPPGSPLRGQTEDNVPYEIKVRGCKRISEEPLTYEIHGRFVNLSSVKRDKVLGSFKS